MLSNNAHYTHLKLYTAYPITFYKPRKSRLKYICNLLNPYNIGSPVRYGKQLYKHILKSSSLHVPIPPIHFKHFAKRTSTLCTINMGHTENGIILLYVRAHRKYSTTVIFFLAMYSVSPSNWDA